MLLGALYHWKDKIVSAEQLRGYERQRSAGSALRRAALARGALAQARGVPLPTRPPAAESARSRWQPDLLRARAWLASLRVWRHGLLALLVLGVLLGELGSGWSQQALGGGWEDALAAQGSSAYAESGVAFARAPGSLGPIRLLASGELLAPALSRPVEVASAWKALHTLASGETLGSLAERYGVSVETLIWANGLEGGDALMPGQLLRVPHLSGLTHTVSAGETLAALAERYQASEASIASFPTNRLPVTLQLNPGSELFIPGAQRALPEDLLRAAGGLAGLAARAPEPAGVVLAEQTNLRAGPSTEHGRLGQLQTGRQVALRAKHDDWLLVELGPLRGWVRADMLAVEAGQVAVLPVSNDFPAPPPRWVWPARGTITSGFGARWGSFHNGLDIANRAWTPIVAARSGVVKEAGWCSGYGYCVKLRHAGGMETIYGHLIDQPVVARGDEVSAGDLIGHMGSTYDRAGGGYSTGVHLHLTVLLNGKAVNPLRFLP